MGKKNTLNDLNDHLFEMLERLNDDDLEGEELEKELKRARGMSNIAAQIIENGRLAYDVMVHAYETGDRKVKFEALEMKDES